MRNRLGWVLGAVATFAIMLNMAFSGGGSGMSGAGVMMEWQLSPDLSALRLEGDDWAEFKRALQHEGTGRRVDRFLDKALSGRPFTVAVIGGSVSKGRGLVEPSTPLAGPGRKQRSLRRGREVNLADGGDDDRDHEHEPEDDVLFEYPSPSVNYGAKTLYSPENMHVLIFKWLNETFPHKDNRFVNGAQGGVGAQYYEWCYGASSAACAAMGFTLIPQRSTSRQT